MAEKYIYALADQSYTVNNSEAVTERLYSAGIRLFIITNGIKYIQTKRFNATALCPYFEDIFISEEIGAEKPSAKFFEEVASRINGYEPSKTLVVGDSLSSDIKGGIGAGLDTCWYNPKGKAKPSDMAITYEITELTQLFSILGV